ncbi:hypothetical protein ACLB1O_26890 [Escherichia coli]
MPLLYHLQTLLLEHPELQLMEANYSQKQKSLTLKMSVRLKPISIVSVS